MTPPAEPTPAGTHHVSGVVNRRSPLPVAVTVQRLTEAIVAAGAKVFAVIDQGAEAARAGAALRETQLILFGNPLAGTPVMEASPLAALDLPLRILVWADDGGVVWMTYLSAEWLAGRYDIPQEVAKPLSAVENLTGRVAARG
jgi:uncharacterized protein (DUF302 family)